MQIFKAAALTCVSGSMLMAGQAAAAQEVAAIAGDNRAGILLALFLPVVGWVGFNIFGPAKNQIDQMQATTIAAGLGLACLAAPGAAEAAQGLADVAADNRVGVLLALFLPVVGWVAFNILGPAIKQLTNMSDKSKGIAIGTGLSLAALAGRAEAAQEIGMVAGDNRAGILLTLFLPVVGWVGFNILGPALNQVDNMKQ